MKARRIRLACGRYTFVDAADYDRVRRHNWHITAGRYVGARINGKKVYLHRFLLRARFVDHKNGNPLDNRRSVNLRPCRFYENCHNRGPNKRSTSGLKCVFYRKDRGTYEVKIVVHGVIHHLGQFRTASAGDRARRRLSKKLLGEFAA